MQNARNQMKLVPVKTHRRTIAFGIPFSFANERLDNFFNSQVILNDGQKVGLPSDVFITQNMNANPSESKLDFRKIT